MGTTVEQVEQLLNVLCGVDLPTLLAFDRKLHLLLEAVRKLISNKSISYKSLKAWQETDYPVSPFLALPCMWHKVFSYKGFVSR
jgi:hypothetical protein